jgi:hypothetical protein
MYVEFDGKPNRKMDEPRTLYAGLTVRLKVNRARKPIEVTIIGPATESDLRLHLRTRGFLAREADGSEWIIDEEDVLVRDLPETRNAG